MSHCFWICFSNIKEERKEKEIIYTTLSQPLSQPLGQRLVNGQSTVSQQLVNSQSTVSQQLVNSQSTVSQRKRFLRGKIAPKQKKSLNAFKSLFCSLRNKSQIMSLCSSNFFCGKNSKGIYIINCVFCCIQHPIQHLIQHFAFF